MKEIPLQAVPSQRLSVVLAAQNCQIAVYQKSTGMYLDLAINDMSIVSTRLCRDRVRLVRQEYLGFVGDLVLMDTQGREDPRYEGLGVRWRLRYLEAADL